MSQPRDQREPEDYDVHHLAIESTSSVEARRRRRQSLITLGAVVLGLFFAFWWAYSYYKASDPTKATPRASATCQTLDPAAVTPAQVKITVLNTTTRQGLAATAAKEFTARGFVVEKVGNDPAKKPVAGPAEVRFGPQGKPAADLVLATIGQGAVGVPDSRTDGTVDVAVGTGYVSLPPPASPTSTLPPCPASPSAGNATTPAAQ